MNMALEQFVFGWNQMRNKSSEDLWQKLFTFPNYYTEGCN